MESEETIIVEVSFLGLTKKGMGTRSIQVPLNGDGSEQGRITWDAVCSAAKEALTEVAPEFVAHLNKRVREERDDG